ncbi:MAG: alcohol dehydrogenase, partial [Tistrella sp.]|nr:alcohol dehydrogenase [Tistrella sp.]
MTAMTGRALIFRRFGDPAEVLALEAQPAPAPAAGEAVVAMTHRSINPSDLIPITGAYAHRVAPPRIAGYEGVGIVERAADGSGLAPGDRVLA